jgi:hypothetical protein
MRLKRAKALDQVDAQEFEGHHRKVKRRKRRETAREREPRRQPVEEGDDRESMFDLFDEMLDEDGVEGVRRRGVGDAGWSVPTRIGDHLRVQAASGFRAAVIELRPGLFLVAEMTERVASPDFGFIPFLAPLMLRAAKRAIDPTAPLRQGIASLFRRKHDQPRQITGPVAEVGWTDAEEVEEVIGCDACDRRRP